MPAPVAESATLSLPTEAHSYFTIAEAATHLGVSRVTIWRWIRDGRLPVWRLGHRTTRIQAADLQALLQQGERGCLQAPRTDWFDAGPPQHAVQFYNTEACLLEAVTDFLAPGLRRGEPAIVVATLAHRAALAKRLTAAGVDCVAARTAGRYVALDAAELLAQFLVAGMPDATRFNEVVGGIVTQAGGERPLHIFGEMVALLAAEGNHRAALRLEELWNALLDRQAFSLLCAYPVRDFSGAAGAAHVGPVCVAHSRVLPTDARTTDTSEALRGLLAALVESSDDAILTKTLDGSITSWNRAAERLYGYTAAEAIGQPVTLIMPPEQADDFPTIMSRLQRGEQVDHYETVRQHKDGHRLAVSVTVSPLVAADGSIIGASAIARDISERRQLEAEREAFAATLTHDLKSPLTAVRGMAQLLLRRLERQGSVDVVGLSEGLRRIQVASERTVRMLEELLDVARIRSGQPLALQRGPCDLVALAQRVGTEQQQLTTRHQLTVHTTEPALVGSWDEQRLERVLSNLVGNAVKYSPDGGEVVVTIACEAAGHTAVVTVADQGLGIPAADVPLLFTAFHRGSNVATRIGGSGIGLLSVKQIVEQHGGALAVASQEGHGTTVRVRLPLA